MVIRRLLVDTGVWYAMFARRDGQTARLGRKIHYLDQANKLVMPWPTMYETLRSKFVKDEHGLREFMEYLACANVEMFDSQPYDERASVMAARYSLEHRRPLSMVDCLIRLIIEDPTADIDGLLTFNVADFHDTCAQRNIPLL